MSDRLKDKVAIVTGGAGGIGASIVRTFHEHGARVLIADISGKQGELAAELGDRAHAIETDVTDDADVSALVARAMTEYGRLDVMCNNAGIEGVLDPLAESTPENFDNVLSVNLRAVFLGMRHSIPAMSANGGGSIINTASIAGLVALPHASAYCASKAGVIALTRSGAVEYAKSGVRVNAICPGIIKTPMLEQLAARDPEGWDAMRTGAEAMTAMGRVGEPVEVGQVALFLASDESSFVTGTSLPVDGGWTAI